MAILLVGPLPLAALCFLLTSVGHSVAISTVSATNASTAETAVQCMDESACSCTRTAIMKCFCPNETYSLEFHFGHLESAFDLLQIGACRRLTVYGTPFSAQPPEFLQFFDIDDLFHDRTFAISASGQPTPATALAAVRPIRRIEFLNVTVAYLALSDFYALNDVENFIVQNSTIKVLGGRPSTSNFTSTLRNIQILSSTILDMRKDAIDASHVDSFFMSNVTVHAWRSSAVRLLTSKGARVVISNCSVYRMDPSALSVSVEPSVIQGPVLSNEFILEGNLFSHLSDGVIRLTNVAEAKEIDAMFVNNRIENADVRSLTDLFSPGIHLTFLGNTLPCNQSLCLGQDFQKVTNTLCLDRNVTFTEATMSPWADGQCNAEPPQQDDPKLGLPVVDRDGQNSGTLSTPVGPVANFVLIACWCCNLIFNGLTWIK